MDSSETESHHSYKSESLQSNVSTLSGLSLYEEEFHQLQYLVNSTKYNTLRGNQSSTSRPSLKCNIDYKENIVGSRDLKNSFEQNEKYKHELQQLEIKLKSKFYAKIERLVQENNRLEQQFKCANNQIERLIRSHNETNDNFTSKEIFKLENRIQQLNLENTKLQDKCANLQEQIIITDLENSSLKTNLAVVTTEKDIKGKSVESLKEKISEQHVSIQNLLKENVLLSDRLNISQAKLAQSDKSAIWYKEQLHLCQKDKEKITEDIIRYKHEISSLREKNCNLNYELSKYKNDIDEVRFQALKEKKELLQKLERINLTSCDLETNVPDKNIYYLNKSFENDLVSYKRKNAELIDEISVLRKNIEEKDQDIAIIKQENADLIAKCLVLQKNLQQESNVVESLEDSRKVLLKKLEFIKESEKQKLCENFQLNHKIKELEVKIRTMNEEKSAVENSIKTVREQFGNFKESYVKVKNKLNITNKELIILHNECHNLFISKNRLQCDIKEKDSILKTCKDRCLNLETEINMLKECNRSLELKIFQIGKTLEEKEQYILSKDKEVKNYDVVVVQYKNLLAEKENKICNLENELRGAHTKGVAAEENLKSAIIKLQNKDDALNNALKKFEQIKNEHRRCTDVMEAEKNVLAESYNIIQNKLDDNIREKGNCIAKLQQKVLKFEQKCVLPIKGHTDDQKVKILLSNKCQNSLPNDDETETPYTTKILTKSDASFKYLLIDKIFNQINVEEFESRVNIGLKQLEAKIRKLTLYCKGFKQKVSVIGTKNENKIKELKILLQVKDKDMLERQKRMDKNNRTLLRKVKEHMRGRNMAEKQLKYLQEMYNTLSNSNNTLNLSFISKENELETLVQLCKNYKSNNEKLKDNILSLEKQVTEHKTCQNCKEFEEVKESKSHKDLFERNKVTEENRTCNVASLKTEVKELLEEPHFLQEELNNVLMKSNENDSLLNAIKNKEQEFLNQTKWVKESQEELKEKDDKCVQKDAFIKYLNLELQEANEKIKFLNTELQNLSFSLQIKNNDLENLEHSKKAIESEYLHKEQERENTILKLRNSMHSLQYEIQSLQNDKFFLQRLSSDLKLALKSYADQNMTLKDQLNKLTREKPYNSLPSTLVDDLTVTGKYDENYIHQLLKQTEESVKKPLGFEIQDCLSKLKEEIVTLQNQIAKKNVSGT